MGSAQNSAFHHPFSSLRCITRKAATSHGLGVWWFSKDLQLCARKDEQQLTSSVQSRMECPNVTIFALTDFLFVIQVPLSVLQRSGLRQCGWDQLLSRDRQSCLWPQKCLSSAGRWCTYRAAQDHRSLLRLSHQHEQ